MSDRPCRVCGRSETELHHIIKRSKVRALIKCELNLCPLCSYHHRDHKAGVHFNKELERKLRLEFQNTLEILWDKDFLTEEEINDVLKISTTALRGLLKQATVYKEGYCREEIIRLCMGGRIEV